MIGVHPRVRVRDQGDGGLVDARETPQRPGRQVGQFFVVSGREVVRGHLRLLLDQVVVVQQPFHRGRDGSALARPEGDRGVGRFQLCRGAGELLTDRRRVPTAPHIDSLLARDLAGAFGQPLDAEQVGPKRRVTVGGQFGGRWLGHAFLSLAAVLFPAVPCERGVE